MATKEKSLSGFIFDSVNHIALVLLCISTLYPFLFLLTLSLSPADVSTMGIHLFPTKVTFSNYASVLSDSFVLSGFTVSVIRTVTGTALTLLITICAAYTLSKTYFPHRNFWTMLIVFTMFIQGGMIPSYLLIKQLGLINSIWSLILPSLVHTFQLIIARNFFMALPEELEESAKIDGANEITILFKIVVPVSMPIIATLGLWTAVWHWNAWFDSIIYITDAGKQVLQVVMRRVALEGQGVDLLVQEAGAATSESIKAATIMITMLPIIAVYPFAQKYFVKGVLVGSLKG